MELVAPLLPLRRARFKRNSTRSTWAVDTESELGVSDFAAGELRLKAYFDCDKCSERKEAAKSHFPYCDLSPHAHEAKPGRFSTGTQLARSGNRSAPSESSWGWPEGSTTRARLTPSASRRRTQSLRRYDYWRRIDALNNPLRKFVRSRTVNRRLTRA